MDTFLSFNYSFINFSREYDFFNFCFKFCKVYTDITYIYKPNSDMTWLQMANVIINIDIAT